MAADISYFVKDAQKLQEETGIPASITLAQIILESSGKFMGGLSGLAAQAKNLFGIKGEGPAGSVKMLTSEYQNGMYSPTYANFRKYNSYYESMVDHAKLLSTQRYAAVLKDAKSVNDYANGLQKAGYATDPNYANKLMGIIDKYNLHQYDKGNFTYTPMKEENSEKESPAEGEGKTGIVSTFYFYTIRALLLIAMFILMVIFFLQAFPAVDDTVQNVANPIKKIKGGK